MKLQESKLSIATHWNFLLGYHNRSLALPAEQMAFEQEQEALSMI